MTESVNESILKNSIIITLISRTFFSIFLMDWLQTMFTCLIDSVNLLITFQSYLYKLLFSSIVSPWLYNVSVVVGY